MLMNKISKSRIGGKTSSISQTKRSFQTSRVSQASAPSVPLFINNQLVESKTSKWIDIHNPATNEVIARCPEATQDEMKAAVSAAAAAFPKWRETPISARVRIMFNLQQLIIKHTEDIAKCITREQGKTLEDARGDVFRGLEVVEHSCSVASLAMGETIENVGRNIDTYSYRQPLGVCAGITPFNFPAMIPLWMFPLATACGNTYVLKPSERDPGASILWQNWQRRLVSLMVF